jgi:hypothetical protein
MTEKSAVETQSAIEIIARGAGWDNSKLLHLMSRRLSDTGRAEDMIAYLGNLLNDEDRTGPAPGDLSVDEKFQIAREAGYTVNEKRPGTFVFNDPHGNDADNGPWSSADEAWSAAYDDLDETMGPESDD